MEDHVWDEVHLERKSHELPKELAEIIRHEHKVDYEFSFINVQLQVAEQVSLCIGKEYEVGK